MADADNLQPPTHNNQQESASDSVNLGLQSVEGTIDKKNEFQLTTEQVHESTFLRGTEFHPPKPMARKHEYKNNTITTNYVKHLCKQNMKILCMYLCLLFSFPLIYFNFQSF